jgi:hypothetical protein
LRLAYLPFTNIPVILVTIRPVLKYERLCY